MIKVFLTSLIFLTPLFAKTIEVKDKAHVSFNTTASPGGVRIVGEANNYKEPRTVKGTYELNPNDLSGHFEVSLKNLDTGINMRNQHMHEKYLQTEKFPLVVLDISTTKYKMGEEASFTGFIQLHGVKKPITGKTTVNDNKLSLDFFVKLSDFNIEVPKFMGITMKEDIHVLAETTEVL